MSRAEFIELELQRYQRELHERRRDYALTFGAQHPLAQPGTGADSDQALLEKERRHLQKETTPLPTHQSDLQRYDVLWNYPQPAAQHLVPLENAHLVVLCPSDAQLVPRRLVTFSQLVRPGGHLVVLRTVKSQLPHVVGALHGGNVHSIPMPAGEGVTAALRLDGESCRSAPRRPRRPRPHPDWSRRPHPARVRRVRLSRCAQTCPRAAGR